MCGTGPAWKREIVPDHKFDFVDTREFTDNGFFMRLKYLWVYIMVLKGFLVYVSDIFSAITMLTTDGWSNDIFNKCAKDECITIPFEIGKWLFVGCIIFSFLLLAYETRKAKKIIASRDISYAFTNIMAQNYYSLRSYDHFCFFDHISNSTKKKDDFAFFVFFTFKSKSLYGPRWKQLCLADGPRQTINALTLYAVYVVGAQNKEKNWYDITKYFDGKTMSAQLLTATTMFTVAIFAISMFILILAAIFYVPLLCYIRGNLKEYVCHKVDKRIDAVIKRRNKERLAKAAIQAKKEARGDFSHLKNKKGQLVAQPLPQPTLPNLSVDDDVNDNASVYTRGPPASNYPASTYTQQQGDFYYQSDNKAAPARSEYTMGSEYHTSNADYPPMPAYNPYSTHQAPGTYANFNPSQAMFNHDDSYSQSGHGGVGNGRNQMYDDDPVGEQYHDNTQHAQAGGYIQRPPTSNTMHQSYQSDGGGYVADAHEVYGGYGGAGDGAMGNANLAHMRRSPAPFSNIVAAPPPHQGGGYEDTQDYPSPRSGGPTQPPSFSQTQYNSRNGPGGYAV